MARKASRTTFNSVPSSPRVASFEASRRRQSGFTIVELLIVVVVIAILAAITIVAYNGVTQQAKSARKDSEISTLKNKMELYLVSTSNYPSSAYEVMTAADLGGIVNSIDFTDYQSGCVYSTGAPAPKDRYCLYSDSYGYVLRWWDDKAGIWKLLSQRSNGDSYHSELGNGDRPSTWPN